jgi:hypothetical protein
MLWDRKQPPITHLSPSAYDVVREEAVRLIDRSEFRSLIKDLFQYNPASDPSDILAALPSSSSLHVQFAILAEAVDCITAVHDEHGISLYDESDTDQDDEDEDEEPMTDEDRIFHESAKEYDAPLDVITSIVEREARMWQEEHAPEFLLDDQQAREIIEEVAKAIQNILKDTLNDIIKAKQLKLPRHVVRDARKSIGQLLKHLEEI